MNLNVLILNIISTTCFLPLFFPLCVFIISFADGIKIVSPWAAAAVFGGGGGGVAAAPPHAAGGGGVAAAGEISAGAAALALSPLPLSPWVGAADFGGGGGGVASATPRGDSAKKDHGRRKRGHILSRRTRTSNLS